jgi:hypothetical protein
MLRYVYGQDELVADFVARMIPHCRERGFGLCKAIGIVDEDDELIAGFVYHNLSNEAGLMEISGAALPGRHWLTPTTLVVFWDYPFIQCGCQMVVMKTPAGNVQLLRQLAALDYRLIAVPRIFGRGRDGVLGLLTCEDWKGNRIFQRAHQKRDEKREAA